MVPRGLEPRTLRLLAVRSNQLSYETRCMLPKVKQQVLQWPNLQLYRQATEKGKGYMHTHTDTHTQTHLHVHKQQEQRWQRRSGSGSRRSSHTPHTYTCTAMRTASVHRHTHHCGHMQEQASTKPQGQRCPLITSRTYETTKHTGRMTTSLRGTRKTGEKGYKRCDTLSKHHQHSTTKTDVEPAEAAARQWPTFPSNMCIIGRYAHGHISAHLQ